MGLGKEKWIYQALQLQMKWAIEDGHIDNNMEILGNVDLCYNSRSTWLQQTIALKCIQYNLADRIVIANVNDFQNQTEIR